MSFGQRNTARFKPGSKKEQAIRAYQSGKIDFRTYSDLTTPRVGGVKFSGRINTSTVGKKLLQASARGSMNMSNSMGSVGMMSTAYSTMNSTGKGTSRGTANMTLGIPPSRESRMDNTQSMASLPQTDSLDSLINTPTPRSQAVNIAKEKARAKAAADLVAKETAREKIRTERGPYALALWKEGKDALPAHQVKVMSEDLMYTPDPMTGISKWPIPGMQGQKTPFRHVPYGSGPDAVKECTSKIEAQRGVQRGVPFKWGNYESDGLGGKCKWKGGGIEELTRVRRSYEQSGMMSALVPGQAQATRQKRIRKPGELPIC